MNEPNKLKAPFIDGLKVGRNPEGKTDIECFAIDYPNIGSKEANEIFPSYKEGFNIGSLDQDKEVKAEVHYKSWVNWEETKKYL
jgi:hypothetical protein